jgi:hypothetical protein
METAASQKVTESNEQAETRATSKNKEPPASGSASSAEEQVHPETTDHVQSEVVKGNDTQEGEYVSTDDASKGASPLKKKRKKKSPPKHSLTNAAKFGGPTPPYTFDVSRLRPVKMTPKSPARPSKNIELLDKGATL